jgi:hypothetical protein
MRWAEMTWCQIKQKNWRKMKETVIRQKDKWHEKTKFTHSWSEMRWNEIDWDEVTRDAMRCNEISWNEKCDKSRDCWCEAPKASPHPIGTAFVPLYRLEVFQLWNFHELPPPELLVYAYFCNFLHIIYLYIIERAWICLKRTWYSNMSYHRPLAWEAGSYILA